MSTIDDLRARLALRHGKSQMVPIAKLHRELADLRAELARERAAHAATRQVLEDAARDRGGVVVLSAEQHRDVLAGLRESACCGIFTRAGKIHKPLCRVARVLRAIGGPEETQRQVDEAHAWALEMESHRRADPVDDWYRQVYLGALVDSPRHPRPDASDNFNGATPAPGSLAEPE